MASQMSPPIYGTRGGSMALRFVLFILASVLVVRTMWPSDSQASPHVTDTSGPF